MSELKTHPIYEVREGMPRCSDYDEDCQEVRDKVKCWIYDPNKGMCPYLRVPASEGEQK